MYVQGKSVITSVPKITAGVIGTHPAIDGTAPAVSKSWHSSKDLEVSGNFSKSTVVQLYAGTLNFEKKQVDW